MAVQAGEAKDLKLDLLESDNLRLTYQWLLLNIWQPFALSAADVPISYQRQGYANDKGELPWQVVSNHRLLMKFVNEYRAKYGKA